jgi:hypothetical protein
MSKGAPAADKRDVMSLGEWTRSQGRRRWQSSYSFPLFLLFVSWVEFRLLFIFLSFPKQFETRWNDQLPLCIGRECCPVAVDVSFPSLSWFDSILPFFSRIPPAFHHLLLRSPITVNLISTNMNFCFKSRSESKSSGRQGGEAYRFDRYSRRNKRIGKLVPTKERRCDICYGC